MNVLWLINRFPVLLVVFSCLAAGFAVAQFGGSPLSKQPTGLPVAQAPQGAMPRSFVETGKEESLTQTRSLGADVRKASGGHSRRRNAEAVVQNGPEQVLYAFQGGNDGAYPGGLIFDSSGNLYGETSYGGAGMCTQNGYPPGCGTVFELSPNGNGGWTKAILYSFQGGSDGEYPSLGLIFDQAGNLYGTTAQGGGNTSCTNGCGTVFELSPNGNGGWTETLLYIFGTNGGASDGAYPEGVIFDKSGNLYGSTEGGGNWGCDHDGYSPCGTIFELTPNGSGGWTETIIYKFPSGDVDGWGPNGGLIFDQSGNLYGTTALGAGDCYPNGCGTVFELSPNGGGGWTEALLYAFQGGSDGYWPYAGVIFDQNGNMYGTASEGGAGTGCYTGYGYQGCGTAFELSPNGSGGWTETTLYTFEGGGNGEYPSGLIFDQSGNLYGTTYEGGGTACFNGLGCGTTFELSSSDGAWTESLLYSFRGGSDGASPDSGLIFDQAGHIYGTTVYGGGGECNVSGPLGCGTVYEVFREPFVAFSPTSLSFGNQTVGIASSPLVTTLTNSGNLPLSITSIQITGANSGDFGQTNNCPSSLPPNNSCNISVTFTPAATGNRSAAVNVTDNAPGSPQSVPLTGVGVLPAVTFSPTSLNLGNQTAGTTSAPQVTTLTNTGQGVLTISSIGITGANSNEFAQTNSCSSSLSPNDTCNLSVTFTPTALGSANASISVTDNAPGSPQTVPLAGTGVSGITFSPPSITFPSQYVGTSGLPQSVTLKNTGDTVLTITNVSASPSDFAPLSACGNSVNPGASCSIGVFFDPTTSGTRNGVLTITDSAINSPQTVPLTGMGEDFSVAPSSSSTATITPGQAANYTVAVAPKGGFNQTVTLSCGGAPPLSTCSVSPSSVTLNGTTSAPVTVTVTTAGTSAGLALPPGVPLVGNRLAVWLAFSGLPGLVLLGGRPRKRHGRLLCGLAFVCVLFMVMTSACGGGTGSSGSGGGTAPGTYHLTVVGTFTSGSANLVHSAKLALVVQ